MLRVRALTFPRHQVLLCAQPLQCDVHLKLVVAVPYHNSLLVKHGQGCPGGMAPRNDGRRQLTLNAHSCSLKLERGSDILQVSVSRRRPVARKILRATELECLCDIHPNREMAPLGGW